MDIRARISNTAAVIFFLGVPLLYGQLASPLQSSQQIASSSTTRGLDNQPALQTFVLEQQNLVAQLATITASGATSAQLNAWTQQNASLFALQNQRAQTLANLSALQLAPTNAQANIPAGASPTLADFLTRQAVLANAAAQIHNQLAQTLSFSASSSQVATMLGAEIETFKEQNGPALTLQVQESQTLANEAAATPLAVPASPNIPTTATPQMATFQTQLYQFRLQRAQLWNQYANATPAARDAAMEAWQSQNAGQVQQLQQQAQALVPATSSTQN